MNQSFIEGFKKLEDAEKKLLDLKLKTDKSYCEINALRKESYELLTNNFKDSIKNEIIDERLLQYLGKVVFTDSTRVKDENSRYGIIASPPRKIVIKPEERYKAKISAKILKDDYTIITRELETEIIDVPSNLGKIYMTVLIVDDDLNVIDNRNWFLTGKNNKILKDKYILKMTNPYSEKLRDRYNLDNSETDRFYNFIKEYLTFNDICLADMISGENINENFVVDNLNYKIYKKFLNKFTEKYFILYENILKENEFKVLDVEIMED